MEFSAVQQLALKAHIEKKYLATWQKAYNILKKSHAPELAGLIDLAEVGLFSTEVGETLEEIRDLNKERTCKELAGIIIRVMNFASRKGINLESVVISEIERNMTREELHGRKLI